MKKTICAAFLVMVFATTLAQSGTNSPYSQYGLGVLSDQATGFNSGMGGLGLGFHEHNQVNVLNPASYTALDSLAFIFDVGASGQVTNFKAGNKSINANNADVEYVVAGFHILKHGGVSFGLIPYTNIGYNYNETGKVSTTQSTTYTNTYSGSGGLHQAYFGLGWELFKGLSIGGNLSYLWGTYNRSMVNSYSDAYANTLSRYYMGDVRSYKVDFGLQYVYNISKSDQVTLGLTYGLGHKLGASPECQVVSNNSQTMVSDTTFYKVKNGLSIPTTIDVGLMWSHNNNLKVGFDYRLQKWGSVDYPQYEVESDEPQYSLVSGMFNDRHKFIVGAELCPSETSRKFVNRIRYSAGLSYATPYLKVNGQDGPSELSASVGVGIPIINQYNNKSMLNVSAQWVKTNASKLISENTFRITIGLTFNERWFAKWKVE